MDEKEELKCKLESELQWVQYRQKMLDIIEEKLQQMRQIAEQVKENKLSPIELKAEQVVCKQPTRVTVTWKE